MTFALLSACIVGGDAENPDTEPSARPGGVFHTGALSSHARTHLEGVARFVPLPQRVVELEGGGVDVGLG